MPEISKFMTKQNELVCTKHQKRRKSKAVAAGPKSHLDVLQIPWLLERCNMRRNAGYEFPSELYPGCFQLLGLLSRELLTLQCLKYICWQEVPVAGWFALKNGSVSTSACAGRQIELASLVIELCLLHCVSQIL